MHMSTIFKLYLGTTSISGLIVMFTNLNVDWSKNNNDLEMQLIQID